MLERLCLRGLNDTAGMTRAMLVDVISRETSGAHAKQSAQDMLAKLDDAKAHLDDFGTESPTAKINVDDATAKIDLDEIQARLDHFGEETVGPKIDLGGVDETNAKLAEIAAALDGIGEKDEHPKISVDTGGEAGGLSGMLTALLALSPAMVDLGGVGAGALLSVGSAALSAGTGIGIFAAAAAPEMAAFEASVTKVYNAWAKQFGPAITPVMNQFSSLVLPNLSQTTPVVDNMTKAFGQLATYMKSAAESPEFHQFIAFVGATAGPDLLMFAKAAGNVVEGLSSMAENAQPFTQTVMSGIDNMTASFARFGQSQDFKNFITWIQGEAPQVEQTIGAIGKVIGDLLPPLAALGHAVLDVVNPILEFAAALLKLGGTDVDAIVLGITGLVLVGAKLAGPISDAATSLGVFRSAVANVMADGESGVSGLSNVMAKFVAGAGGLGPALGIVGGGIALIGATLLIVKSAEDDSNNAIKQLEGNLNSLPTNNLDEVRIKTEALKEQIDKVTEASSKQNDQFKASNAGGVTTLIMGSNNAKAAVSDMKDQLNAAEAAGKTLGGNLDELQSKFGLNNTQAENLAQTLGINLSQALTPTQVQQFTDAMRQNVDELHAAVLQTQQFGPAAAAAKESVQALTAQMNSAGQATSSSFSSAGSMLTAFSGQANVTAGNISTFFAESTTNAAQFAGNVQKAIQQGYNPALIEQLLEAGPAQAGPILQSLVSNYSQSFQGLVNAGYKSLQATSAHAVDEARLTQEAVSSKTSQMADELPAALAVSSAKAAIAAGSSAQSAVAALQAQYPNWQAVATQFGEELPKSMTNQAGAAQTAAYLQSQAANTGLQSGDPAIQATGTTSGTHYANAFQAEAAAAGVAGTNVATSTKNAAAAVDFTPAANANLLKYIGGVNAQLFGAQKAGTDTAQGTLDAASKVDGTPAGKNIVTGMMAGVAAQQPAMNAATLAVVKNAENATIPDVGGQGVGAAIDAGIAAGINQNTGGINAAAAAAAQGAVSSAKASINAHSPSQLAADEIGLPFVQGIALGITNNMHLVHTAISGLGTNLTSSFSVGAAAAGAGSSGGTTILQVTTPLTVNGQQLANTVTQYQLRGARATGSALGQYAGGTQSQTATGINANSVAR